MSKIIFHSPCAVQKLNALRLKFLLYPVTNTSIFFLSYILFFSPYLNQFFMVIIWESWMCHHLV